MSSMALPYVEPLVPREPGERQIPEPPRRGEPGGPPCAICNGKTTAPVWSDERWTLHPPVHGSLHQSLGDLVFTLRGEFLRIRLFRVIRGGIDQVHAAFLGKLSEVGENDGAGDELVVDPDAPPIGNRPASDTLKLQAILFGTATPSALINGKTLFVQDKIGAYQVIKIEPQSVTLRSTAGDTRMLALGAGP